MRKMLAMLLALLVLLNAAFALAQDNAQTEALEAADMLEIDEAEFEEAAPVVDLSGMITEIADEYVMLLVPMLGEVQANLTEDTIIEGVEELEIGQTAVVLYDGMMTRSLPPQITALQIGVYAVEGEIVEIVEGDEETEGSITIVRADTGEEVIITLTGDVQKLPLAVGDMVVAYTTGVSTMSLPPQMNAIAIMHADEEMEQETEEESGKKRPAANRTPDSELNEEAGDEAEEESAEAAPSIG